MSKFNWRWTNGHVSHIYKTLKILHIQFGNFFSSILEFTIFDFKKNHSRKTSKFQPPSFETEAVYR